MTDEEKKKMNEQLDRIERCLVGDEEMGQFGLVSRVNNHAGRLKRLERWAVYLVGAGGGIALLFKIAVELWPQK